jgi:hypothetical protein
MRKGMLEGRSTWLVGRADVRLFRRTGAIKLVVCLALLSLPGPNLTPGSYSAVQNQQPGKQESGTQEFQNVGRGIEHLRMIRGHKSESEVTGPWVINLLRVDLKQVDCRVAHALDEGVGLETTSSIRPYTCPLF